MVGHVIVVAASVDFDGVVVVVFEPESSWSSVSVDVAVGIDLE